MCVCTYIYICACVCLCVCVCVCVQFRPDPVRCQAISKPVWHTPLLCVQWKTPDDGQRNCPKHVEFYSKNKFQKLVHLVWFYYKNLSPCTVTWTSNTSVTLSLTSGLVRGGWVFKVTPGPLYTREKDRQPILQEAGWSPEPVWTAAENLAPNEIAGCIAT